MSKVKQPKSLVEMKRRVKNRALLGYSFLITTTVFGLITLGVGIYSISGGYKAEGYGVEKAPWTGGAGAELLKDQLIH